MWNASKTMIAMALVALASCSGDDPDKKAAQELLDEITLDMEAGRAEHALELMDTLNTKYGSQIELRKQAMAMRPAAIEAVTIGRIQSADSIIAVSTLEIEALKDLFEHVPGDDLEGYYIVKDAKGNFLGAPAAVEPRVNDDNMMFYIVAQTRTRNGHISQVVLNTATEQCESEAIPAGSARVVDLEGSEMATFLPEEVDALGAWAAEHADQIKGAMIYTASGHKAVALTPAQARAFGTAWKYANAKQRNRQARILREKLDRQLQMARDYAVNIQ